jgi:hypothetical protein
MVNSTVFVKNVVWFSLFELRFYEKSLLINFAFENLCFKEKMAFLYKLLLRFVFMKNICL